MKYSLLLIVTFALTACVDDRGCWEWESQEQCDARLNPQPQNATVGVYRCESTQTTLTESRMPLISTGLDVKSSVCAYLKIPVTAGAEACIGGSFTEVDIHTIPYASRYDAVAVPDYDYKIIYSYDYTVKTCM